MPKQLSKQLIQELNNRILLGENRQTVQEVIEQRTISKFLVGRRCTGTRMVWVKEDGEEKRKAIPKYKLTRLQLEFSDGLKLNVHRMVLNYYKGKKKIEYFNWYD